MDDLLAELGGAVAEQLELELAGRSFGVYEGVSFTEAVAGEAEGEPHFQLSWQVSSVDGVSTVKAVVLPEFLELEPELLVSQLVALLVVRVLGEGQS